MNISDLLALAGLIVTVGTGSAGLAVFLFKQFASNALSQALSKKIEKLEGRTASLETKVAILDDRTKD